MLTKGMVDKEELDYGSLKLVPSRELVGARESLVLNEWIFDMEGCLEQCCVKAMSMGGHSGA